MDPLEHTDPRLRLLVAAADPVRLRLLALLREPCSVLELCHRLDMAQPRVSHHLAILRDSGLVVVERDGRRRVHRWNDEVQTPQLREMQELLSRWLGVEANPAPARTPAGSPARAKKAAPGRGADIDDFLL